MADIRAVLHGLADEVGQVSAPPDLTSRGRRRLRRRRFAAVGTAGLAAAAVGAATLLVPHSTSTTRPKPPADGTAAELVRGHWTIGDRPAPDRVYGARLSWTGDDVIALGGRKDDVIPLRNYAWSPSTRQWRAIAEAPASIGLADGATAWTGSRLLVMPGYDGIGQVPAADHALLYDPARDAWSETPPLPARVQANGSQAVATDGEVVVAGIADARLRVLAYEIPRGTWSSTDPVVPAGHEPVRVRMAATSHGIFVWSMWQHSQPDKNGGTLVQAGVDVFRQNGDAWNDITSQWPRNTTSDWTFSVGDKLELGGDPAYFPVGHGPYQPGGPAQLFDLDTLTATALPADRLDYTRPIRVWTGEAEVAIASGGFGGGTDPVTPVRRLFATPRPGGTRCRPHRRTSRTERPSGRGTSW